MDTSTLGLSLEVDLGFREYARVYGDLGVEIIAHISGSVDVIAAKGVG